MRAVSLSSLKHGPRLREAVGYRVRRQQRLARRRGRRIAANIAKLPELVRWSQYREAES
jgi:hypothetical protein